MKKKPLHNINRNQEYSGTSLSKSTIKRCLHECKHRGFTTRCKPLVTFKHRKARLNFPRKHLKKPPMFWNKIIWTDETKISLYQTDGKRKVWRKLSNSSRSKARHFKCQTWWRQCYDMGMYGCQWNGLTAVY